MAITSSQSKYPTAPSFLQVVRHGRLPPRLTQPLLGLERGRGAGRAGRLLPHRRRPHLHDRAQLWSHGANLPT